MSLSPNAPAVDKGHFASPEERRLYWEALGKFVEKFSQIEWQVAMVFWHSCGISYEIASIVFSGTNLEAAKTNIMKILDIKPIYGLNHKETEEIFSQLTAIQSMRNRILHYGVLQDENGNPRFLSSRKDVFGVDRHMQPLASSSLIDDMTADLEKISAYFVIIQSENRLPAYIMESHFRPLIARPWQYNRAPSSQNRRKNRPKSVNPRRSRPTGPG